MLQSELNLSWCQIFDLNISARREMHWGDLIWEWQTVPYIYLFLFAGSYKYNPSHRASL